MTLEIVTFSIGPMENNTYLLVDPSTRQCVVVDPSFQSEQVEEARKRVGLELAAVWLTHAHFDHIVGIPALTGDSAAVPVGLHPADLPLWRQSGGAQLFGVQVPPMPEPALLFAHGQQLTFGGMTIEVRHTPGHTPGHVLFSIPELSLALCGDVIFYHGMGRTDLPGGDFGQLIQSIHDQIFTLPPDTRLLSGHGQETTVAEEQAHNPFVV